MDNRDKIAPLNRYLKLIDNYYSSICITGAVISAYLFYTDGISTLIIVGKLLTWLQAYLFFRVFSRLIFYKYRYKATKDIPMLWIMFCSLAFLIIPLIYLFRAIYFTIDNFFSSTEVVVQIFFNFTALWILNSVSPTSSEMLSESIAVESYYQTSKRAIPKRKKKVDQLYNINLSEANRPVFQESMISSPLKQVINSLKFRVEAAARTKSMSLYVMIAIVIIGGGTSIGSELFNDLGRLRLLEKERAHIIKSIDTLTEFNKDRFEALNVFSSKLLTSGSVGQDSTLLIQKRRELALLGEFNGTYNQLLEKYRAEFKSDNTYQSLLAGLEKDSETSWRDIAMKITIAALTLFLVQIFFNIYKYNQQQISHLMSKGEALELYSDADQEHPNLREKMIEKMEAPPKFDKGPTSPAEKIFSVIEQSKKI